MGSLPLHAAIVHVPLGLAVVVPLVALAIAVALWRGKTPRRTWLVVVGLQAVLVAGAFAALRTGSADEERVESVVAEQAITQHEEAAEAFLWSAVVALALAAAVLPAPARLARYGAAAAAFATLVVAGLGIRTGHAGGALIYRHNAASAYATSAAAPADRGAAQEAGEGREERGEP